MTDIRENTYFIFQRLLLHHEKSVENRMLYVVMTDLRCCTAETNLAVIKQLSSNGKKNKKNYG